MLKNIGSINGLYPMPVTIVGTKVNGKVNWINIAHVGIVAGDMMLSMGKGHYSNIGIRENQTLSISLVSESMLVEADYVGIQSGHSVDKSQVFDFFEGDLIGAPMIKMAPVTMECQVIDVFETEYHEHFIVRSVNTFVEESYLDDKGRIDYSAAKPVLFEMQKRSYLSVGDVVGDCWQIGKKYYGEAT